MPAEAGYYREQGLDVELVNVGSTSASLQAMVAGEVHLSTLDPATSVQASLSGAEVALLYGMSNRLVFSIVTQPTIQQPDDLRGKTLGVGRLGSSGHTAIRVALASWGLAQDRDVSVRQVGAVPNILAGLQAGQLDGGSLSPPTNGVARRAGFHELIDLSTQGPEYASVAIGGLRAWVAGNEEAVRRFGRAYVQGLQRFQTDKAFALEVYRKYLQTDDAALLDATYEQFRTLTPSPPYVSETGMANALADLVHDEPRAAGRQASEWVDARFVRELEAAGLTR
jgi:NitT/TauT family transport system substrate-binding protein